MTPIGHISISIILSKFLKKLTLIPLIIGGILPDIDFIFLPFTWFNSIHRVYTHNFVFIFLVAFLSFFWKKEIRKMVFYSLIIGGLAHLLFDSILDSNPSNGIGIAIFFPFSSNVYSPFNLISQSYFTNEWNIKEGKFASSILSTLIEIPFWIIAGYFEISKKYK